MTKTQHKSEYASLGMSDRLLWQKVTATVRPLLPERQEVVSDEVKAALTLILAGSPTPPESSKDNTENRPSLEKSAVSILSSTRRKVQRKFARQNFDHGARLDLHGFGQKEAYDLLLNFIRVNFARNQSLVLVITGKGQRAGRVGVLRQLVPQWLETAPFRPYIYAVEVALRRHGGEGALYVKLRQNLPTGL